MQYTHIRARVDTKNKLQRAAKRADKSLIEYLHYLANKPSQTGSDKLTGGNDLVKPDPEDSSKLV